MKCSHGAEYRRTYQKTRGAVTVCRVCQNDAQRESRSRRREASGLGPVRNRRQALPPTVIWRELARRSWSEPAPGREGSRVSGADCGGV